MYSIDLSLGLCWLEAGRFTVKSMVIPKARQCHGEVGEAEAARGVRADADLAVTPLMLAILSHPGQVCGRGEDAEGSTRETRMSKPPARRGGGGPREAAEAAFQAVTTKLAAPAEPAPAQKASVLPNAKELVSLRIDRDVLEHFQAEGPGWQERINEALRRAAGK